MTTELATTQSNRIEAFSFGDPTPVLDGREIMDYAECWFNGRYYDPPVSQDGLARCFRAAAHHSSAIFFKRNALAMTYIPHPLLPLSEFIRWSLDYLTFGNGYLQRIDSRLGRAMRIESSLAKFTRVGRDGRYFFLQHWYDEFEFPEGTVFHIMDPDINQELYGVPEYLSALQSALLNESATLFRRRYYLNGSHAGFILYMTDATQNEEDITNLRKALKESKGPGNFRNLFLYAPNGKKDGVQLIPVSEVAAKDDILNIKNISRDDILAAHRVPPQLMGIIPSNTGGFGDVEKAAEVWAYNELAPLQAKLKELNNWIGDEVIRFKPYEIGRSSSSGLQG